MFISVYFSPYIYIYIYVCVCVCVCVYIYGEIVDFGESDKIKGKVNKPNTYNGFSSDISFFIHGRTSSDFTFSEFFYIWGKNKIDKIMENVKSIKGEKGSTDKGQINLLLSGQISDETWYTG